MKTYGSLFTGFGGACLGARAAGLELAWGNELDPAIAEVGNYNIGGHIRVGDVLEQNPHSYERVDVLHASPPCTRASVANGSAEVNEDGLKESPLDIALANKCIEFVEVLQPEIVTIENVWGYRRFQAWRGGKKCEGIQSALYRLGYWVSVEHVNAADMGVPQTRRRMIVRAIRGGMVPHLPQPKPWVGWYAAIEDILHTLPDSQFAPWQLARLPEELQTILIGGANRSQSFLEFAKENRPSIPGRRTSEQPCMAVAATSSGDMRALLVSNAKTEFSDGTRQGDDPAFTVTGESNGRVKAFLMGKNQDKFGDGIRYAVEPAQTIGANEHGSKAFIVDCQKAGDTIGDRGLTIRDGAEPCFTLTIGTGQRRPARAYDGVGRVVAMTPRALARFQSFPDWYQLPESKTLAAKGIGNAVPPLVMQRIYEGLLGA